MERRKKGKCRIYIPLRKPNKIIDFCLFRKSGTGMFKKRIQRRVVQVNGNTKTFLMETEPREKWAQEVSKYNGESWKKVIKKKKRCSSWKEKLGKINDFLCFEN
jgi:hypothetical protein